MENKNKVCIMGMGYIGLPTAALLANKGYQVQGVDIDQHVIDTINRGEIHIVEPELDAFVQSSVQNGFLVANIEPAEADIFMIAVPTPFHVDRFNEITNSPIPNIDYIVDATKKIASYIRPGNLVLLESTSPIGTTDMIASVLKKEGVNIDSIFIAHSPERVLPGNIMRELIENDRLVGGINDKSTKKASEFYRTFAEGEVLETTSKTAEMAKLTENSFRDVNIAFANELSIICDKNDIDVWELISLANKHPRVNILQPGPGVGGHCIAVDPWFLVNSAPRQAKLIATARKINDDKPDRVVEKLMKAIHMNNINNSIVVTCLGLSYKPDIDDIRESPAVSIVTKLISKKGIDKIIVVEPNIKALPDELEKYGNVEFMENLENSVNMSDVVLLLVNHKEFECVNKNYCGDKIFFSAINNHAF